MPLVLNTLCVLGSYFTSKPPLRFKVSLLPCVSARPKLTLPVQSGGAGAAAAAGGWAMADTAGATSSATAIPARRTSFVVMVSP